MGRWLVCVWCRGGGAASPVLRQNECLHFTACIPAHLSCIITYTCQALPCVACDAPIKSEQSACPPLLVDERKYARRKRNLAALPLTHTLYTHIHCSGWKQHSVLIFQERDREGTELSRINGKTVRWRDQCEWLLFSSYLL